MKKACLLLLSLALPAQAAPDHFAACLASINEVAADRGISADVRAKVVPELQWRDDVIELDDAALQEIRFAFEHSEDGRLKPVYEALGGEYDYGILECVRAADAVSA